MPTAAPQLTGEVLLGQLTDRLLAIYDQALECEQEGVEFRNMQQLIVAMGRKLDRELSALVNLLSHKDKFLSFWVGFEGTRKKWQEPNEEPSYESGFEDDLKNMVALVGDRSTIGSPEIISRVKGLLLSFTRLVKAIYGPQQAAVISARVKECESRRLPASKR